MSSLKERYIKFFNHHFLKLSNIYAWTYISIICFSLIVLAFRGVNMFRIIFDWATTIGGDFLVSVNYATYGYGFEIGHPYPPLLNFLYFMCGKLTSVLEPDAIMLIENRIFAFCIQILPIFGVVYLISVFAKNSLLKLNIFYLILVSIPAPFFTTLKSHNIAYFSFLFALYFIFNFDSDSRFKRELSIIFLAISTNLRILPAIYSLLIVKDLKLFSRYLLYSLLLFFIPMYFILPSYNYIDRFLLIVKSIFSYTDSYTINRIGNFKVFYYLFKHIFGILKISVNKFLVSNIISKISLVILLVYCFKLKSKIDKILCVTFMQFLIGGITYHHIVCFIAPLAFCIIKNSYDKISLLLFCLMTIMLTFTFALFWIPYTYDRVAIHSVFIDLLLSSQITIFIFSNIRLISNNCIE